MLELISWGGSLCGTMPWIWNQSIKRWSVQVKRSLVWFQASVQSVKFKNWCLLHLEWIHQMPVWTCMYSKSNSLGDIMFVCLYMDDFIFTGSSQSMIDYFKKVMAKKFKMIDLGLMAYFLGIKMKHNCKGSFIS